MSPGSQAASTLLGTIGAQPTQVKETRTGTGRARIVGVKECPMCCEPMRLHSREVPERPGMQSAAKVLHEWVCPECDYYEEAEAGEE